MEEHYGCVSWKGAANTTDANQSMTRVKSARWDGQECWQKLNAAQPESNMESEVLFKYAHFIPTNKYRQFFE